ncbi:hypothetical protein HNQ93_004039 [Hymenobacter luteus]|uniref:Uncharacterized protein n=3 Tax=Hymenobacter TaxID=89966 RepID=A0A3R9M827_9BACT|nr:MULTISPECIES: hypothetical protein [Hymenobacter]MBB4603486.1 hypothetical protein [Hymenobacter latericoloratus]MBB6061160.1 hypothetical protein [Hymenobacter luteus]RSK24911.1 hypothetical protein EI290_17950 [Hymenobacter metallilatus]
MDKPAPNNPEIVEEGYIILLQLGGRRFLAMTGANQLLAAGRTATNPNPWLRMNLRRNEAGVNRLKITLMPTDTYTVEFYHQQLVDCEAVITRKQTFDLVYGEDLPGLFTSVTGYDTHL